MSFGWDDSVRQNMLQVVKYLCEAGADKERLLIRCYPCQCIV